MTDYRQVPHYVGLWVTLEGEVSRGKAAQIVGVEIDADSHGHDIRGRFAEAHGILETWTVTQKQIDQLLTDNGPFAHRGPGRFYRLVQPGQAGKLATARPLDETRD